MCQVDTSLLIHSVVNSYWSKLDLVCGSTRVDVTYKDTLDSMCLLKRNLLYVAAAEFFCYFNT